MNELLELLHENAKLSVKQLAAMLNKSEQEIADAIEEYKKKDIIKGYKALINWDKAPQESVSAIIELKVTPQPDTGFDAIAKRIMLFDEVESIYLMAGTYDFAIMVRAKTIQDISAFVSRKLSTLDSVLSTSTHFVLTRYKDSGIILSDEDNDERRNMLL